MPSLLSTVAVLYACSDNETTEPPSDRDTWEVIQSDILTPNCTETCHTSGTTFAQQSGLVLTSDVAYDQLVDRSPTNAAAAQDGLLLVPKEGFEGLEALSKSFLWEKINAVDQEHFYADHPYYGALMPLGNDVLTNGQLRFIREWIVAGAPRTGQVVDEEILLDVTRYEPPEFVPLAPPANGIQFHLGPFDVAPNFEREFDYFAPVDTQDDLLVNRVEIAMRPGSHHFILYTYRADTPPSEIPPFDEYRDFRNSNGDLIFQNLIALQYQQFVAGTQWPHMNYSFPQGVAVRVPHFGGLDLNSHYVNRTSATQQGEVYANLYFADPAQVDHIADMLWLNHDDFSLPPGQVTTLERTFTFPERVNIIQLFSHAHEHMEEFRAYVSGGLRDGELVYFSLDWEHPPILELDPPLTLETGEGIRLSVTYNNWTDRTLYFGLRSVDEMMMLFGYYYTD